MQTEKDAWIMNGFLGVFIIIVSLLLAIYNIVYEEYVITILFILLSIIIFSGITIIAPNEAKVILFFGRYIGSLRKEGIVVTVPFSRWRKLCLKTMTASKKIEVSGNEYQLIIFYKIVDTAKAAFEVQEIEPYLYLQAEVVLLILLGKGGNLLNDMEILNGEVNEEVKVLLNKRTKNIGVEIIDIHIR